MSAANTWVRMRLRDAPLGTRFRYIDGHGSIFVLIGFHDAGLCADDQVPNPAGRQLQGVYSVAESRKEFDAMEAEVLIPSTTQSEGGAA